MALNYISIGKNIKSIREIRGLSQAKLSERINRSPTYISYIESGIKGMSMETFVLIANALNISADELLSDNLENTTHVSNHKYTELLADCSQYEMRVLLDITTTTKKSLRNNSRYFRCGRE
jgi:transcriptional regulator with XRE-family HTH domain